MGGDPKNWTKDRQRRQRSKGIGLSKDETALVSNIANDAQNKYDIFWMEKLLTWDLSERHKKQVQYSLDWLRGASRRTLGTRWRRVYNTIEGLFISGKYSKEPPEEVSPQWLQKQKRREVCVRARRQEYQARTPAWSSDPTLLPKKPPGG